jgi:hypothetical protein
LSPYGCASKYEKWKMAKRTMLAKIDNCILAIFLTLNLFELELHLLINFYSHLRYSKIVFFSNFFFFTKNDFQSFFTNNNLFQLNVFNLQTAKIYIKYRNLLTI